MAENAEVKLMLIRFETHTETIRTNDPTAHAEIQLLRKAGEQQKNYRLIGSTLYVTLEPCAMCAGAISQSRFKRLVFGTWDEKAGAVGSVWDLVRDGRSLNKVEVVSGVMEQECGDVLKSFFSSKR